MADETTIRRLKGVLRLGKSDHIHEADSALRKALSMMDEHGITIDALLDRIGRDELPQNVYADLAYRYCFSRSDMGPSAKEAYYQAIFLRISRMYAPTHNIREVATEATETKPQSTNEPPERSPGKQRADTKEEARTPPRSDWKSRMDEARSRETREKPFREPYAKSDEQTATHTSHVETRPERSFFREALHNPARVVHLFFVCVLYGLPRAFLLCIILAGVFRENRIHTFDGLDWVDFLSIVLFPFLVWKGRSLVRHGWFSR